MKEERENLTKELELRKKENDCFLVEISRRDSEIIELDKQLQLLTEQIKKQKEKEALLMDQVIFLQDRHV